MGHCLHDEDGVKHRAATLARALAPEEIRRGDYVTALYVVSEWPSWFWCDDSPHPREEVVRICTTPACEPTPMKVRAVCLPFVLVKLPCGERRTLDLRRCRLARLDRRYARNAWRAFRKRAKKAASVLRKRAG
jgi:hypothetical protein